MNHQARDKQFVSSSSTCTSVSSSSSSSLSPINKLNNVDYAIGGQQQQQQQQQMSNMLEHALLQTPFQTQHVPYLQSHSMDPILSVGNNYASETLVNMNDEDVDVINQLEQVINLSTNQNDSQANYAHNSYDPNQQSAPQTVKLLSQNSTSIYSNDSSSFGQTYPHPFNSNLNVNEAQRMNVNIPFNQQQQQQQQQQSNRVAASINQSTNMVANSANSMPMLAKSRLIDTSKDDDLTKQKRIEAITKHLKSDLMESFKLGKTNANKANGNNLMEEQFTQQQQQQQQQSFFRSQATTKTEANYVPNVTIDTSQNLQRMIGTQISPSTPTRMRANSNSAALLNDEYMCEMVDVSGQQVSPYMSVGVNNNTTAFFGPSQSAAHHSVDLRKKLQERLQRNAANTSNQMVVVQPQQLSPQVNYSMNAAAFNVKNEQVTSPMSQPIMSPYQTPANQANMLSRANNNSSEFLYQPQASASQAILHQKLPSASSMYKQPQNSPISHLTTTVTVTTQNYSANQAMPKTYSPGVQSNMTNAQQYQFQNNNSQKVMANYVSNTQQVPQANTYPASTTNSLSHPLYDSQTNSPNFYLSKTALDMDEHQLVGNRPASSSSTSSYFTNANKLTTNTDTLSKSYNPNSSSMPQSLTSTPTKTNPMLSIYNNSPVNQHSSSPVLNNIANNMMPVTNDHVDYFSPTNSTTYNQHQQQQQQQQHFYQQQSHLQNSTSNVKYARTQTSNRSIYSNMMDINNKLATNNEHQFMFDDDLDVNNLLSTPTNDHSDHLSFDTGSLATSSTATTTSAAAAAASSTTTTTTTTSSASATLKTSTANGPLIDAHHSYQHQPVQQQQVQQYSSNYPSQNSTYHAPAANTYYYQSSYQNNSNTSQTMDLFDQEQHTSTTNMSIQNYQQSQPVYQPQVPINNNPSIINNYNTNININNPNAGVGLMIQDDPRGGLLHQLLLD